jgi:hypothetical protein
LTLFVAAKPYLTLGTIYILTDALYDWGLLRMPHPFGDLLYFGRYSLVIGWYSTKFLKVKLAKRRKPFQHKQKGGEGNDD